MNKQTKAKVSGLVDDIRSSLSKLEDIRDEEQDKVFNYPENLQGTDRYFDMEEAVETLDSSIDAIDDALIEIESII